MRFRIAVGLAAPLVAAFIFTASTPATAAGLGEWCSRDLMQRETPNCAFGTLQQCLRLIGAWGGRCERNTYVEDEPAKARKITKVRHHRRSVIRS